MNYGHGKEHDVVHFLIIMNKLYLGVFSMQKIGIGYENYKEFIDQNLYYVDKTLFIRDVLEKGGKVTLFTRPRRFGKTLALSMLRTFFEQEFDRSGNIVDNSRYFEGMKIQTAGEEVLSKLGQYPVIKLSLKSAKQPNFYTAFMKLREEIIGEFSRHRYLSDSENLVKSHKEAFNNLRIGESAWEEAEKGFQNEEDRKKAFDREVGKYSTSLKMLSECLFLHHGTRAIILLDEYDVPLENAYYSGFYKEMVGFIRSLFESALKTNDALEFAVVTGCLRISRESIFTGMNNLQINSIRNNDFGEAFGFTQDEVEEMLSAYGLDDKVEEVRQWYDGYLFGDSEVYNPWSVINYVHGTVHGKKKFPEPYWANTSSNAIIKDLVNHADDAQREELDRLIDGGTIEKQIHEDITYDDVHENEDNLWNFLFFTGYMKKVSERSDGEETYLTMCIPNIEIKSIYRNQISRWFEGITKKADRSALYRAIAEKDANGIGDFLTELLEKSISTFNSSESFYHGFFLSLMYGMPRYSVRSNREEGDGRPDVILYPNRPKDPAYLFELKAKKKFNEMDAGIEEAFAQIDEKRYEEGILDEGFAGVISFGVCFCRKAAVAGLKQ